MSVSVVVVSAVSRPRKELVEALKWPSFLKSLQQEE